MKITEVLNNEKATISFEVFPPKKADGYEAVKTAVEKIAALHPAFMSITYGAGGTTAGYTMEIAEQLKHDDNVTVLPHFTCVSSTKEYVEAMLERFRLAGVENIMALRGDLPQDGVICEDFPHAADLIAYIKARADLCIGGACYPEGHIESANKADDLRRLKEKVDAGCDFLTTQMFFDNNILYNFLYKIREAGITVPIIPGIMPITNANQVERAIALSGSFMPMRFKSLVDKFGSDPAAMKQAGIAYATDQIIDLFANGIKNVHVYSMNKPEVAEKIVSNLSDILGK